MMRTAAATTPEPYPDNFAEASKMLSNTDVRVRDDRDGIEEDEEKIDADLFEFVARALTDVCLGTRLHDRKGIRLTVRGALKEEGNECVEVELYAQSTPNVLNYLANSTPNVAFMGAATRDSKAAPNTRYIPEGWMRIRYHFFQLDDSRPTLPPEAEDLPPLR